MAVKLGTTPRVNTRVSTSATQQAFIGRRLELFAASASDHMRQKMQ